MIFRQLGLDALRRLVHGNIEEVLSHPIGAFDTNRVSDTNALAHDLIDADATIADKGYDVDQLADRR